MPTRKPSAKTARSSSRAGATSSSRTRQRTGTSSVNPPGPNHEVDDPIAHERQGGAVTLPLTSWHVPLPQLSGPITVPILNIEITPPDRQSAAFYLVLAGLAAAEVVEWPLALLVGTAHLLAKQHRYPGLAGAAEAFEDE